MSAEREEQVRVNRSLAWVGTATTVMSVLDLIGKGVVLALWVDPEQYGVATLALAAIPIIDLATELGLTGALIQQGDHTPARLSTVFWLNMALSLVVIALIFFVVGPGLAARYDAPIVGWMLQAHCAKLFLQNFYMVPGALMIRDLRFREFSLVRLLASAADNAALLLCAPVIGIWCFVLAGVARAVAMTAAIQYFHPWLPRLMFAWQATRSAVSFGLKTSLSRILFFVYSGLDVYVVGEFFGRGATGLYRAASDLALDPARIISTVVVSVAFPAFARARERQAPLDEPFLRLSRLSFIVVGGFLVVVLPAAPDLLLLLDERWAEAAPAARVLGIAALLRALSAVVPPLLDGVGRPALTLAYMTVAAVSMPLLFVASAWLFKDSLGYLAVAWSWVLGYPLAFLVLLRFALKHSGLTAGRYALAVLRLAAWAGLAIAVGFGAREVALELFATAPVRAIFTGGAAAAVFLALLVVFEGITPRTLGESLRAPPR